MVLGSPTYLAWVPMFFEKSHFFDFHLWALAILGLVEYSTGSKPAKYRPEPIHIPHGPFRKKWSTLGRGIYRMPLEYVIRPYFPKIAYFDKVLRLLLLLRFGVPRCCFSESSTSGLSEKYMVYGVIPSQ